MTIRGLALAARAVERPDYLRLAEAAADFALQRMSEVDTDAKRTLHRSYVAGQLREAGVLDDYAYLAEGLLELHRATGDAARLAQTKSLTDALLDRFEDPVAGGFFMTAESTTLFARPRRVYDNVEPSGSGVALRVLVELARLTEEPRYSDARDRTLESFGNAFDRAPSQVGTAVVALAGMGSAPLAVAKAEPTERPSAGALPRSDDFVQISVNERRSAAS